MRRLAVVALMVLVSTGCLGAPPAPAGPDAPDVSLQRLEGTLASASAAERELVPDQAAGQAHREVYVAHGTTTLVLRLETRGGELHVRAGPRGCEACPIETQTEGGAAEVIVDAPAPGPWQVEMRAASPQAPEVVYTLVSEHTRAPAAGGPEVFAGSVVAVHTGAVRVSPDQLGDVLREVWVPEGADVLLLEVEASSDLDVVVGRWTPARDREGERSFPTTDGRVRIEIEAPEPGGWYVIFFHPQEGPGVDEISYTMTRG